jgi:hypothetical protein
VDYNDDADLLTDFFFTDADLKVLPKIFDNLSAEINNKDR